jgi:SAM-dependent methyltransferase
LTSAVPDSERALVSTLRGLFADPARQERYISDGWRRMQIVLSLLEPLRAAGVERVLELGANPYVMTTLIRRRLGFEMELANYFGEDRAAVESVDHAQLSGEPVEFRYRHFNIERERFPYPDGHFDGVLFCEILEHLLVDADHAVSEIARVLRPGGFVVLSTPNATRVTNLYFLALGRSVWEGYSPNGPYGRHNREFTFDEVDDLLARHGFEVVRGEARNVQDLARRFTWVQWMRPRVWNEHLFFVGRRAR